MPDRLSIERIVRGARAALFAAAIATLAGACAHGEHLAPAPADGGSPPPSVDASLLDGARQVSGASAHALSAGGGMASSPSYRLNHALGQPAAGASTSSSPHYRIARGILPRVSP